MTRCNPPLQRKRQVLMKEEAECGVAETLTAADVGPRVNVAPTVDTTATLVEREVARATLSPLPARVGERTASIKLVHDMAGSGDPAVTPPESDLAMRACFMNRSVVRSIDIGAITGGPFVRGEVITGGTSTATATVLQNADDGATRLLIREESGTLADAELLTGGTSGATATAASDPADAAFSYKLSSSGAISTTIRSEEDGYQKTHIGCMGSFGISIESSNYAKMTFDFMGAVGVYGDQALTPGVVYPETVPPILQSANFVLDRGELGEFQPVFRAVGIELGNSVAMRKDGNAASGLISAIVGSRAPKMTFSPEMMMASEFDIFNKQFNADLITVGFQIGTEPGNTILVFADEAQVESNGDTEADSVAALDTTLRLNSTAGDTEFELIFI